MKAKEKYQFRRISGRLEVEVTNAELVFGNKEILRVGPFMN